MRLEQELMFNVPILAFDLRHVLNETAHELDGELLLALARAQQVEAYAQHARVRHIVRMLPLDLFAPLAKQNLKGDAVHDVRVRIGGLQVGVVVEHDVVKQLRLKLWHAH